MIIIPAVDIKNGKCVRLYQGKEDEETVYAEDPALMARRWEEEGAEYLHLVDLDGAFRGRPENWEVVRRVKEKVRIPLELGGGIRSLESIEMVLAGGIERAVLGTRAAQSLRFLEEAFRNFRSRVVPSIDAREGDVVVRGWTAETGIRASALGTDLVKIGFKLVIYTDTTVDGTLRGPAFGSIENFLDQTGLATIAAGGVASPDDISRLKKLEGKGLAGVIIGKALYEGKMTLKRAIREAA